MTSLQGEVGSASAENRGGPIVEPGRELAPRYVVLAHLNRGNRLDVYDVWSSERDARCVAKTLRPDRSHEGPARRSLVREGRLLRRFAHPHIVRAYETVETVDGGPVVILETLGGETLGHLFDRVEASGKHIAPMEAAIMGRQLVSALRYLHGHGLLHLDLKPGNVIVEAGRARVIDLSIARPPGPARSSRGTYDYMAPEQTRSGALSEATDVWGLGAVLFEALTFRVPFEQVERVERAGAGRASYEATSSGGEYPQEELDAPSVRRYRRIPMEFAELVDRCLLRDPSRRPPLSEIAATLDRLPAVAAP